MIKKQKTKEMSGESADPKTGKRLLCIKETVSPGYGHFHPGQIITDPLFVGRFSTNPNFQIQEDK